MEEFAQILNKPSKEKFEGSYEDIAIRILEHSALPKIDLLLYFKQIIFNVLIGNTDAHLKNFALLETKNGMRLAPAYDLVNTLMYEKQGHDKKLALSLMEEEWDCSKVGKKILFAFGTKIGLPKGAIELAFKETSKGFSKGREKILVSHPLDDPNDFRTIYNEVVSAAAKRIWEE
jgi:serine/threonine-protein kinase HipA